MSNFGVEPICEAIEFPVSTYYAVKKREGNPSLRAMRDEELPPLIRAAREEVISRKDSWMATTEWVSWYKNDRLHSWCGHRPPLEFEQGYRRDTPEQPSKK